MRKGIYKQMKISKWIDLDVYFLNSPVLTSTSSQISVSNVPGAYLELRLLSDRRVLSSHGSQKMHGVVTIRNTHKYPKKCKTPD